MEKFKSRGIIILGINPDSVVSHNAFSKQVCPSLMLLSDPDASVIRSYGVFLGLGSKGITKRAYLLVDKDRRILYKHIEGLSLPDEQSATLLKAVDELVVREPNWAE